MKKKEIRGFKMDISETLFSNIMENALGLPPGTLEVRHVTGEHMYNCFTISATTNDERFPVISEGSSYPTIYPIVESQEVDGVRRIAFVGFRREGE